VQVPERTPFCVRDPVARMRNHPRSPAESTSCARNRGGFQSFRVAAGVENASSAEEDDATSLETRHILAPRSRDQRDELLGIVPGSRLPQGIETPHNVEEPSVPSCPGIAIASGH